MPIKRISHDNTIIRNDVIATRAADWSIINLIKRDKYYKTADFDYWRRSAASLNYFRHRKVLVQSDD